MGGGEVARYLGTYGSEHVSKAVFISSVPPFLLKTADNTEGLEGNVFNGIQKALIADRPAFLSTFLKDFYNVDVLGGTRISDQVVQSSWNIATAASAKGTLDCVPAWGTDFRKDLARISVPTLVMHGDADRILPIAATGIRTNKAVKGSHLVVVKGGPHGITWTHADKVNAELVDFLGL
jgi:non-heme chloroperoxidase